MKGSVRRQKCDLTGVPAVKPDLKTQCVTVLVYEEKGKTVLQPLATEQETQTLQKLFQNNTLKFGYPTANQTLKSTTFPS